MRSTYAELLKIMATGVAAFAAASAQGASIYYVSPSGSDTFPGTQSQPWQTIQKAANAMVAGDKVIVTAGTYNESVSTVRDGSAAGRITFQASGTVKTNGWRILHNYVTMSGFSLDGTEISISSRGGTNGSYCEVLNNSIRGGSISMTYKSNPTGCLIKGNHLFGTVSPEGDAPQIQLWGTNSVAEQNEIGPNSDIDAFRFFGSGHIIRGNYIHDTTYSPGSLAHSDGFQTYGDNGDDVHDIVIENNRFINSEGQLFNTSQDGVSGIHDLILRNNVFANYSQNANVGLPNFYIYNNTFYNTGIIYQVTGGPGKPFNGSNMVVKNNMFIGVAGCGNPDFDNVYNNPSGLPMTRSNNFYATCAGAALRNFSAESGGINGGTVGFANPAGADFTLLSSSAAINKGLTLSGFNYDLKGAQRGTIWDLGAYEYQGVSPSPSPSPTVTPAPSPTMTPAPSPSPSPTVPVSGQSLFTTQVPQSLSNSDGAGVNYELGLKFVSNKAGTITAIRFYKSARETGTHVGKIYSSAGALLAKVTFTSETASGWQVQKLATPLRIAASTQYVVSVNTGNTYYVATVNGLASQVFNGALRSAANNAGVYGAVGSKPSSSWQNSNYFRDIVFVPSN